MALALEALLSAVADLGGSDLHMRAGSTPAVRVDGELRRLALPVQTAAEISDMIVSTVPTRMRARFLDGDDVDYALESRSGLRFRVNAFSFRARPGAVLRLVASKPLTLDELGMPEVLHDLALRPHGLTLVTGRTGSGKSTTLAAMIEEVNRNIPAHILTLEDPIEVLIPEGQAVVTQREMNSDVANFAQALKAALRQDPNLIMVGEARDEETMRAALTAAETGHHVITTLHTIDAQSSVNRIIDMFPTHEQPQVRVSLAAVLNGVICQRLVPKVGGGRVVATEVAVSNGRLVEAILDPGRTSSIREIVADGAYHGMHTFHQDLVRLLESGEIDWANAVEAATDPHDLEVDVRRAGLLHLTFAE